MEMDALPQDSPYAFLRYNDLHPPGQQPSLNACSNESPVESKSLQVKNASSWTYCGPLLSADELALPRSFHKWAALTMSHSISFTGRLMPFLTFLRAFLLQSGVKNYWLTIRATKSTHEYDTPRWHVDDEFSDSNFGRLMRNDESNVVKGGERRRWKLATALLGPPTLFLQDNASALNILRKTKALKRASHQHECTSIRCLGCSTYADSVRQSLAADLGSQTTTSPNFNEVAFFRLGDAEGAVHTEPKCNIDRVFVNVVPGTEEELRGLMTRWGMQFPRAWCLGVPGGLIQSDERETFVDY